VTINFYDAGQVEHLLDYPGCIAAMRRAMQSLSESHVAQPLRQIVKIADKTLFGVMPGDLASLDSFGAKLVSVVQEPARPGRSRHRGVVVVFSATTGELDCIVDAEAVTAIRTASATAAATDALARGDAKVLAIFGAGAQAETHIRALGHIRNFERILLWGRSIQTAQTMATRLSAELGHDVVATDDAEMAAGSADVICTVSGSAEPILFRSWVGDGTHINLVGSSFLGPVEIDSALVRAARYFADYRPGVLAQASELAIARDAGLIDDSHVVGEIGEVHAGTLTGRRNNEEITIYKSLGHVVQDLAAARYVHSRALSEGTGI
jgi:ornithine cyclodeaminase